MHTAVARVRSSLGNNVLLRCGTVGVPIPELSWSRADGKKMNGTGVFVLQLNLHSFLHKSNFSERKCVMCGNFFNILGVFVLT